MFSSSSRSSSTVRNDVRRTISSHNSHNSLNEPGSPTDFRPLSRGPAFRDGALDNPVLTAFDNFDHHDNLNGNLNENLRNLHNNHNELTIETSSRIARPVARNVANRNNNNFVTNDRKPLNAVRPLPRINELPRNELRNEPRNEPRNELRNEPIRGEPAARSNDLPDGPVRVPTVNGNVRRNNVQPSASPNNPISTNLLSNATVTIDSKCLDCICYGSTKCNLR